MLALVDGAKDTQVDDLGKSRLPLHQGRQHDPRFQFPTPGTQGVTGGSAWPLALKCPPFFSPSRPPPSPPAPHGVAT